MQLMKPCICTLRQLEDVLHAVNDLQAAVGRELADVARVEEAIFVFRNTRSDE